MKQVMSWVQKIQLSRALTAFFVGLTFFISTAIGQFGYALQAQAATVSSKTGDYAESRTEQKTRTDAEQSKESGEGVLENVREKLNLDEPLPEGTKAFFKQVQGKDVKVEEPRPSGKGETPKNE